MTDESQLPLSDEIAELQQCRLDLLDMIQVNRDAIARCEELLARVDAILHSPPIVIGEGAQTDEPASVRRTFLQRFAFRRAS
jgi:hypothetical protein